LRQRFIEFAAANRLCKQPNVRRRISPTAGRRERHQRFSASKIALAFSDKSEQRKRARIKRIGQKRPLRQVLNRAKLAAAVRQLPFRHLTRRARPPGRKKHPPLWSKISKMVPSRARKKKHSKKRKCKKRKAPDGPPPPLSRACRPIISAIADRSAARSANG